MQTPSIRLSVLSMIAMPLVFASACALVFASACVVDSGKQTSTSPPPPGQTTPPPVVGQPTPPTPPTQAMPPEHTIDCPNEANPAVHYKLKDPTMCARALIQCAPGQTIFTNECGCGCVDAANNADNQCPDEAIAGVSYKSKDANQCARIRFACAAGQKPFSDAHCGCGCMPLGANGTPKMPPTQVPPHRTPKMPPTRVPPNQVPPTRTPKMPPTRVPQTQCPKTSTPGVTYTSRDSGKCARIRFRCKADQVAFSSKACGCGCMPKPATKPTANKKCPEASIVGVDYKSKDTNFCARARIVCAAGAKPFSSPCGCGCIPLPKKK